MKGINYEFWHQRLHGLEAGIKIVVSRLVGGGVGGGGSCGKALPLVCSGENMLASLLQASQTYAKQQTKPVVKVLCLAKECDRHLMKHEFINK